jgi:hypothetical protein
MKIPKSWRSAGGSLWNSVAAGGEWVSDLKALSAIICYFGDNSPMQKKPAVSSRKAILSVILTFACFSLGVTVEAVLRHEGVRGWPLWIDNVGAALMLGLVVILYERRRERELIRKLQVIELMNHHVRNALQPVMYLPHFQDQQLQLNTIRESVQRIDWALREILPGAADEAEPEYKNHHRANSD